MKILALMGSPRKGSNTDILIDKILEGAKTKEHTSEKVYLYDNEIKPCLACYGCTNGDLNCVQQDGMQEIYPKMDEADLILFGTPIYWFGSTGPMKNVVDRLFPYIRNKRIVGKKGLLVSPSTGGPASSDLLIETLKRSLRFLKMEYMGEFISKASRKAELKDNEKELHRAFELGASL